MATSARTRRDRYCGGDRTERLQPVAEQIRLDWCRAGGSAARGSGCPAGGGRGGARDSRSRVAASLERPRVRCVMVHKKQDSPTDWPVTKLSEVLTPQNRRIQVRGDEEYRRIGVRWYADRKSKRLNSSHGYTSY